MARERYLPLAAVAEDYGVSVKTLRRRIAEGALPAYRVGGQVRVREEDLHLLVRRIPTAGRGQVATGFCAVRAGG